MSKKGIEPVEVRSALALSRNQLSSDSDLIPTETYLEVFNWAAEHFDDPLLGAHTALEIERSELGLIGYLVSNVKTIKESFDLLEQYHYIFSPDYSYDFTFGDDQSYCEYKSVQLPTIDVTQDINLALGFIVRICRTISGPDWKPISCDFTYERPKVHSEHQKIFGDNLNFSEAENRITFDSAILSHENPNFDPNLSPILLHQANQFLNAVEMQDDIVKQVQWLITSALETGFATSEIVANQLNISVRQLHRKLSQRGTTFKKVRDIVILDIAKEALVNSNVNITQIALRLRYSETSAFNRMFKKSIGLTPLQYRRRYSLS